VTVYLANGGTITVRESGAVEFRDGDRVMRDPGRGDFDASVSWIRSLAFGRDVRYVKG
jgi:hypothetical protein